MSTAESRPAALTVTGFKQLKAAFEVGIAEPVAQSSILETVI